jgi:predicted RNA-binding protein with PIN domain
MVMNHYLKTGTIENEVAAAMIRQRKVYPCFFGSALKMEGVDAFLQSFDRFTESPVYPDAFGARVFKIARDSQGNRLTYIKITGGTLKVRMELSDEEAGWSEKVTQIRIYSGERYEAVNEAEAGTVCALTGLSETFPGEGLGREKRSGKPVLQPVLTYRILLPDGCDPALMLPKLRMIEEEEPELHIVWKEELQEIQAQVMGEVQIQILQRLIYDRYSVKVQFDEGNIVYKETIVDSVEGIGHFEPLRHYAEVHLWMEPGESGIQVESTCSEDLLDKNWQRLILTHLQEREHCGVLTGAPLTDVRITLVAGRAHLKHTEGGDFREATYRAVRQGLMQAQSVLLEPYYSFHMEVPETAVGRAMTDIERMGGTFSLEQGVNGISILTGEAPVVTMRSYSAELVSYTKGRGRISFSFAGYRRCHNMEEVVEQCGYDAERDTKNPSSSVFCAHGSGFYVSWNQVKEYAHIDTGLGTELMTAEEDSSLETFTADRRKEEWIDVEEIDEILRRTSYANRKESGVSHKGISGKKIRSLTPKVTGLSKPNKKTVKKESYLLVDGYNVIFSWEELRTLSKDSIDSARGRLMDILCNYQGFKNCNVILVFDAYRVQNHRTEIFDYHNIHVVFTREAETADQYIEKFAHNHAKNYHITVATSDGLEQIIIRGEGCRLLSSRDFEAEVKRAEAEMKEFM